jgi:hypothetical protein
MTTDQADHLIRVLERVVDAIQATNAQLLAIATLLFAISISIWVRGK